MRASGAVAFAAGATILTALAFTALDGDEIEAPPDEGFTESVVECADDETTACDVLVVTDAGHRYVRAESQTRTCEVFERLRFRDGGTQNVLSDAGQRVRHAQFREQAPDGGIRYLARAIRRFQALDDSCRAVGEEGALEVDDLDAGLRRRPFRCACRRSLGLCRTDPQDGGALVPVPFGVTVGPGYPISNWQGLGCRPKPCVEMAGYDSWPVGCPNLPDGGSE